MSASFFDSCACSCLNTIELIILVVIIIIGLIKVSFTIYGWVEVKVTDFRLIFFHR